MKKIKRFMAKKKDKPFLVFVISLIGMFHVAYLYKIADEVADWELKKKNRTMRESEA